ncbi:MAG: nitronate monooxygenase [Nitriliruptoraceae bacterium]
MGVGVSSWRLANTVARTGNLGVVSGTAVAVTIARTLGLGDPGGHIRRALDAFPIPAVAERVYERFFGTADSRPGDRFKSIGRPSLDPSDQSAELTVAANFVEVFLAKEGHNGPVGINFLEKIQLPTLPSLYGAMLANVDYVLMGAGVPARIPATIDALTQHSKVALPVDVVGADKGETFESEFDPARLFDGEIISPIDRPLFLAIVSSATLARYLATNSNGSPDGFVVEYPVAGGHNAPPRGKMQLDDQGEPIYGSRDAVDLDAIAALGLPFWLAGGYADPDRLADAQQAGAVGVQVGTAFAFCRESGLADELKSQVIDAARRGQLRVRTDPKASPTGYPFKLLEVDGTLARTEVYNQRVRRCDLGYLREMYKRDDGRAGYRCPAEPVDDYLRKGGDVARTEGSQCLCNGLMTDIGLGQVRNNNYAEPALLTAGDDAVHVARLLPEGSDSYGALDVLSHILGRDMSAEAGPSRRPPRSRPAD